MKAFLLLLGVICLTCRTKSIPVHTFSSETEYAILFDAGSSGTRMEIYQFLASGPTLKPSDILELSPSPSKVEPGLSSLAEDPSQVEEYMTPLLESAKKTIPEDKQASTPIFLLATAGMRLLPEDQADAILNEVQKLFNDKDKCPFMFQDDNDARIITGQTEGIYSWVTVNFLAGAYRLKGFTYGSLDLGGASHQNTWIFNSNHSDVMVIAIAGRNFSIFARSYLGFGQDQARERYLRVIAQKENCDENSECVVKSPCHNKGFKEPLTFDDQERVFEGTARVNLCRRIISKIFFCHSPDLEECPFSDQPKLEGKFYAFSAFYYVLTGIKAVCSDCENNQVSPAKIRLYSKSFCKTDYNELKEDPYAKNDCFGANYIYELLTEGYGLRPYRKITVANSLNGFDLGWTLGAVLHNTGILNA
ncbi:ectonucleoside triphosphate diphosphohydrolase 1-like [Orbicella faveolata]|uniref:ectonucleoside triphosphate diphosphohydrolase 1-like n=1 Tax=Orbicella faveolata TaxID=48498 RepID=UPI0009E21090|nr:ectonucleoside triphosphate diphosphohydrolase 1-like [Orbicella faveolata]